VNTTFGVGPELVSDGTTCPDLAYGRPSRRLSDTSPEARTIVATEASSWNAAADFIASLGVSRSAREGTRLAVVRLGAMKRCASAPTGRSHNVTPFHPGNRRNADASVRSRHTPDRHDQAKLYPAVWGRPGLLQLSRLPLPAIGASTASRWPR
jgi:hypothetical protein